MALTIVTLLLGLLLIPLLYAMRTLVGMRHRILYPLFRFRNSTGTRAACSIRPDHCAPNTARRK